MLNSGNPACMLSHLASHYESQLLWHSRVGIADVPKHLDVTYAPAHPSILSSGHPKSIAAVYEPLKLVGVHLAGEGFMEATMRLPSPEQLI